MIQFDALFGQQGGGTALGWPAVSYTGDHVRRVVQYGAIWYYEWEFQSSGTLTVTGGLLSDFYLMGPGGNGGNGGYKTADLSEGGTTYVAVGGGGGGAGTPVAVAGQLLAGAYSIAIGAPGGSTTLTIGGTTYTAVKGNNGSVSGGNTVHGTGFTGTYYAYGDTNFPIGTATPTTGDSGTDGVRSYFHGRATPDNDAVVRSGKSGRGYGAGGGGGTRVNVSTSSPGSQINGCPGAPGVVMMRIPVAA